MKDITMLAYLRQNSRTTLKAIAQGTGMPVSSLFEKIRTNQIITRNTCLLDYEKIGFNTQAYLLVKARDKEKTMDHIRKSFNVNSISKINNGWDYMLHCIFKNLREMEQFVQELEQTGAKTQTYYIIEHLSQEQFLTNIETLPCLIKE